jgi:hypothetical protein
VSGSIARDEHRPIDKPARDVAIHCERAGGGCYIGGGTSIAPRIGLGGDTMTSLQKLGGFWAGVLAVGLAVPAQAALFDRGGGLIYDDVLDVTWLQDANLAASNTFGLATGTSLGLYPGDPSGVPGGINADGHMNWPGARFWIDAMNNANYLGYSDWRLPLIVDVGDDGCNFGFTGTDCGYNVLTGSAATTVYSELASLFSDSLDNLAYFDTSGSGPQAGWEELPDPGPFANLQSYIYWSGAEWADYPSHAWFFNFSYGNQDVHSKDSTFYAWAVRPGDVIPEPASLGLVGTALGALLGVGWRRRRR